MPIGTQEEEGGKIVKIAMVGTIVKDDYKPLSAEFTRLAGRHGDVKVLLNMTRFHSWQPSALWQDIKFNFKFLNKIKRLAVVGDSRWQHAIASLALPLTSADVRYFEQAQILEAHAWLNEEEKADQTAAHAA